MGGLGSGRPKSHGIIEQYIPAIDIRDFKKDLAQPGEYTHDGYTLIVGPEQAVLSLAGFTIELVTTACNYGGHRWWILAPCCIQSHLTTPYVTRNRVQSLYITTHHLLMCRECTGLHYASQFASMVERHITREKYLLANYGYTWASIEYESMKHHYFQVTPEYAEKRARSELDRELQLYRRLISFHNLVYRMDSRAVITLRSEEDRELYITHAAKEHGQRYALSLLPHIAVNVHIPHENRGQEIERLRLLILGVPMKDDSMLYDISELQARKKDLEEDLMSLDAAA